ncbi:hypothetical protein ADL25_07580 [Streptomyces sp. NRRL F-5122]|nr:hypothetical protein ADL25_07580 [Streptomyces sp. NRRL F-5122]
MTDMQTTRTAAPAGALVVVEGDSPGDVARDQPVCVATCPGVRMGQEGITTRSFSPPPRVGGGGRGRVDALAVPVRLQGFSGVCLFAG